MEYHPLFMGYHGILWVSTEKYGKLSKRQVKHA
jgi:hypothetical protein